MISNTLKEYLKVMYVLQRQNGSIRVTDIANNIDARLIHEATIGKIAGEQLIKLMTLGLSKKKAEETIINGFLK